MQKLLHNRIGRLVLGATALIGVYPLLAQTIPGDAKATCTVTAAVFKTWFESGTPSLNGVVNPANSVTFPNTPNCSFYQWSMQMFLWLTSPAPATYGGGGGRIMDSPAFFDVSPPDSSGNRTFIKHTPGLIRALNVRAAQPGPHGLQVVFDTQGQMLEVQPPQLAASGKPLLKNAAGAQVELDKLTVTNGKPVFLDTAGKTIASPKPILRAELNPALTVQKFVGASGLVFINGLGSVVPVEQGQADGSVLESQGKSLVYYALMVNDVYAYFLTGSKDHKLTPAATAFPTTAAGLKQVTDFAKAQSPSVTFPDPNALAIEVKTSWVLASSLPSTTGYITMEASVPTYNESSTTKWTPTPNKTVQLAMVGLHVVGSAAGHPEMIWATFEHEGNAPNAAYTYVTSTGTTKSVAQTAAGTWVFSKSGSSGPFNVTRMSFVSPDIEAVSGKTIGPSDTLRVHAWGANASVKPNPADASVAASNTEIISINNSVRGMMPAGDPRDNYFTTGATWTVNGFPPTGAFSGSITNGVEVGTSQMSNTTMETYEQFAGMNCFACHARGSGTVNPNAASSNPLSHIYSVLKPLF
jgi:hypothetical protein